MFAEDEDEQGLVNEDERDDGLEPVVEQADLEPNAEEKRLVKNLHDNLGRPACREMARS